MSNELDTAEGRMLAVKKQLAAQNPIHSIFANVLEKMGGEPFIQEWAEDNPTAFVKTLVGMAPGLVPTASLTGDINIRIHNDLGASPLDGGEKEVAAEFTQIDNNE